MGYEIEYDALRFLFGMRGEWERDLIIVEIYLYTSLFITPSTATWRSTAFFHCRSRYLPLPTQWLRRHPLLHPLHDHTHRATRVTSSGSTSVRTVRFLTGYFHSVEDLCRWDSRVPILRHRLRVAILIQGYEREVVLGCFENTKCDASSIFECDMPNPENWGGGWKHNVYN